VIPVSWFGSVEPRLIRRYCGGWLAVSPPDAPLHIGVVAETADRARTNYAHELGEWRRLLEQPPSLVSLDA